MPDLLILKMTRTLVRSLVRRPACRMYPRRPKVYPPQSRGGIGFNPRGCILCGLCARKCPADALIVRREDKTWQIDRLRCITCGACVDSCPKHCLFWESAHAPPLTDRNGGRTTVTIAEEG